MAEEVSKERQLGRGSGLVEGEETVSTGQQRNFLFGQSCWWGSCWKAIDDILELQDGWQEISNWGCELVVRVPVQVQMKCLYSTWAQCGSFWRLEGLQRSYSLVKMQGHRVTAFWDHDWGSALLDDLAPTLPTPDSWQKLQDILFLLQCPSSSQH